MREAELDDPAFGALRRYPMPDDALLANGPYFANRDALEYLILGRHDSAQRLLEGFVPRLLAALPSPSSASPEQVAHLYEEAHVAVWLRDGRFDIDLATSAFRLLRRKCNDSSGQITVADLLHLMLLAAESGATQLATDLYLQHDPKPLRVPPNDLRFSRNPRAVLFAHFHLSDSPPHHERSSPPLAGNSVGGRALS
jgi:hypothetical protein